MRIRLATLVLVFVLGLVAAAVAKPRFSTKLSFNFRFDALASEFVGDGKVRSDKQGCVTDRRVLLYNENAEGPLGSDRAEQTGAYEIRMGSDGLGGRYYTKVRRLERPNYVCKADESRKIELR